MTRPALPLPQGLLAILLALLVATPAPAASPPKLVLRGATVHTAARPATVQHAQIEISDGTIRYVGPARPVASSARVIDLTGRHITPGFIDPWTQLGLVEVALDAATNDSEENTEVNGADHWARDAYTPDVPAVQRALSGGVTTVAVFPGSHAPIAGRGMVVKLLPTTDSKAVLNPDFGLQINLGQTPRGFMGAKKSPMTRMGTLAILRRAFSAARRWLEKSTADQKKHPRRRPAPPKDPRTAFLAEVLEGKRVAYVRAHRRSDIEAALRLGRELGFTPVILGATEASALARGLASAKIRIVFGPGRLDRGDPERMRGTDDAAAVLQRAGVDLSLTTYGTLNVRNQSLEATHAVFEGMNPEAALVAVTLAPARLLGVARRVGSLEVGKDADLVVWDANPLYTFTARPLDVYVEGRRRAGLGARPR